MRPGERPRGLVRLVRACGHSLRGLYGTFLSEAAFRQEVALAVVLIPAAFWVSPRAVERVMLIGSVLLVLIVELLNSGIETVVDRVGTERHQLSGLAKDMGSAAVLLALLNLTVVWLLIGLG